MKPTFYQALANFMINTVIPFVNHNCNGDWDKFEQRVSPQAVGRLVYMTDTWQ